LRARSHPTVSTPVTWEEVEHALKRRDASLLVFEAPQVLERVAKKGDLFAPVLTLKQTLPQLPGIEEARLTADESAVGLRAQAPELSGKSSRKPARAAGRKKARKV